jgi:hypothetical protein
MRITLALALLLCFASRLWGANGEVSRVLRTFDFEERRLGNVEDLPMHWEKVQGPGLPYYVNGRLSKERVRNGEYSFRFELDGGSLIYRYGPSLIPVTRGAHYRIEGFCQTTVLPNARARITAYLVDQDGHQLSDSVRHSDLYAARSENEGWKKLDIDLAADRPQAAWLVLELELLQASQYAGNSLGQRTLHTQDIHGSAWFDDITVSQVPQVLLQTRRPGNVFGPGDTPQVVIQISDSFTRDLAAQLVIKDADGKLVYQRSGALDLSNDPQQSAQKQSILPLPAQRPGWYQASVVMTSGGRMLDSRSLDFIILPPGLSTTAADARFGINATELPFAGWSELPEILPLLSAGRVKLAVWTAQGDVDQIDAAGFDALLEHLHSRGITPTACLLDVPPTLAQSAGGKSWDRLLRAGPEQWRPQLAFLVSRHAGQLDRWQLGADGSDAFVADPKMRQVYAMFYRELSALLQNPDLAMPWPAWYELQGELPATVALSVPTAVLPAQLPLYMQDISRHKGHNLSLSLELLDRERYGRLTQIRDLAQRVIYALSADATRIDFALPFSVREEEGQIIKQPRELLMIIRTLTATLAGTTFKGRVPIADGVDAFLFDRDGHGVLALWSRGNSTGVKQLALNLGTQPAMVDLWGNVTPLLRNSRDKLQGKVQVSIGPMPVFLIDIDGPQAQLRASVAVDQPLLESSFKPHARRIRFVNSYPQAISGTLKIKAPAGWTISPPTISFNLNSGETLDRELTISFPYNSNAGARSVDCEFTLQNDPTPFVVPLELRLGLSDLGMQTIALRDGKNVIVQQMITNYGEAPINYSAFALFPGEARHERLVTNLGPGQVTMRKYLFSNVKILAGTTVRVGVKELDGVRILNDEVPVQ